VTSTRESVDALVIGAGPAGAASAALLARVGFDVLVADRAQFPREKACSEYLSPEAVRVLDRLGVVGALEQAGARPLEGTIVYGPEGARLHGIFGEARPAPFRPTGLSVARRVLDLELVRAARAAGAGVLEGTRFEDLVYDGGAVAGAVLRGPRGRRVIRSRLVIGADGLRSGVAARLGARSRGRLRRVAFVAHVAGVPGLARSAEMHVGARGYVGLNPIGDDVANVALVVPASSAAGARGRASEYFFEGLERFPGVRGRVDRRQVVRPVLATGPFAARSRRVTADGALLVGDAADFFDPFTGEGICAALRGAELVAAYAGAALGERGAPTDRQLAGYRRARIRAFAGKWAVERLIGYGMLWPRVFDHAVGRMGRRPGMAHTLIGVTGDFVPARAALNPLFLARLLF
jgi:flavin-dependent dehydrogenase